MSKASKPLGPTLAAWIAASRHEALAAKGGAPPDEGVDLFFPGCELSVLIKPPFEDLFGRATGRSGRGAPGRQQ